MKENGCTSRPVRGSPGRIASGGVKDRLILHMQVGLDGKKELPHVGQNGHTHKAEA